MIGTSISTQCPKQRCCGGALNLLSQANFDLQSISNFFVSHPFLRLAWSYLAHLPRSQPVSLVESHIMDRIGWDEWTREGIMSQFQMSFKKGYLIPALQPDAQVFTKHTGLGWRFGIKFTSPGSHTLGRPPIVGIIFDPIRVHQQYAPLTISVTQRTVGKLRVGAGMLPVPETGEPPLQLNVTNFGSMTTLLSLLPVVDLDDSGSGSGTLILSFSVTSAFLDRITRQIPSNHVQSAVTSSIRTGRFVDVAFYAFSRRLRGGRVDHPKPVYANSAIVKGRSEYLYSLLSSGGSVEPPQPILGDEYSDEYDYPTDSDFDPEENGEDGKLNGVRSSRQPDHTHSVLIKDISWRTLHAVVMYIYTGEVAFSWSRSTLDDNLATEGQPNKLLPCSPKSLYRAAHKLGIPELEYMALEAIREGLSEENIVDEVFSTFTCSHKKVQEVEIDILWSKIKSPQVSQRLGQITNEVALGKVPHCQCAPVPSALMWLPMNKHEV
ncbi:hypothetical protein JAAARDRAFT_272821 [Jaapia argillacea MUCL 33604]|uniref:BTB domain-containing protein n=1 Tax=Jaapia argillacea MUCL 33604 TaxID=933084 RepID=A0A067Q2I8_9AGAM|nr:hypothetical protein JAAARDRAFT_272821 [Jaapia argillacea MUCL 33604]